ncbi:MAG: 30S ribosomal protein S2 [Candidatus Bipolaricaulota bacterium]
MQVLTMKELLETGVHFGHRKRKWNPKMAPYIFTERKGIHIVDLEQTVEMFERAYFFVRDRIAQGGEILFVGTKKQVQATIEEEARRCGAHYVNHRWLGGTLTNFATIKQSINRMKKLEIMAEEGEMEVIPPKEATKFRRALAKLQRNLNGLRHLERLPDLVYVIDPDIEANTVREAKILNIPVIAIVDTNCDPDPIDFLIPGNDDAIKATKLITSRLADAVLEGREGRQADEAAEKKAKEAEIAKEGEKPKEPKPASVTSVSEEAAAAEEEVAVGVATEDKISDSDAVEGEETDRDDNSN